MPKRLPKWAPKSIKKRSRTGPDTMSAKVTIFETILTLLEGPEPWICVAGAVFSQGWHFLKKTCFWTKIFTKSTILGAKMVPNVVKNATQNRYGFWVRFLIPFGSILSPFWGLKVGGCRSNFHLKWSLCSLRWSLASLGCHFGVLFDKSGRCSPIFIKNNGIYTSIFLFWFLYVPLFVCSSVFLFEHIGIDHLHASDQHRGTCDQKVTKFEDCIGYLVMQTAHHGVDPVIVKLHICMRS